jgi:hypothetical protein
MRDRSTSEPERLKQMQNKWSVWEKEHVKQFNDAGGEPIYRSMNEKDERFINRSGEIVGPPKKKARKKAKQE